MDIIAQEVYRLLRYDIFNPYSNQAVTKEYVSIIEASLRKLGYCTKQVTDISRENARNATGIVVVLAIDVIKAKIAGYKTIILWTQGVSPEESFMRNRSQLRFIVLSYIEKYALKRSSFVILVSDSLRTHFASKYSLSLDNYYIMPCFNNEIDEKYFFADGKYDGNLFIYAGSLAPWQCFEQTVKLFKRIEDRVDNANLRVLVKAQDEAKRILDKYGVRKYTIGFVPQENIGDEMAKAKFGFCLREENVVNSVATPTKLSTYVAHGVMPIYSKCIVGFREQAQSCPYCFCIDEKEENSLERIIEICNSSIKSVDVYRSFACTFSRYYSKSFHETELSDRLRKMLLVTRS